MCPVRCQVQVWRDEDSLALKENTRGRRKNKQQQEDYDLESATVETCPVCQRSQRKSVWETPGRLQCRLNSTWELEGEQALARWKGEEGPPWTGHVCKTRLIVEHGMLKEDQLIQCSQGKRQTESTTVSCDGRAGTLTEARSPAALLRNLDLKEGHGSRTGKEGTVVRNI